MRHVAVARTRAFVFLFLLACGARTEIGAPMSASTCSVSGVVTLAPIDTKLQDPFQIAISSTDVYWLDPRDASSESSALKSVPKCGGAVTTITAQSDLAGLAVDASGVYFGNVTMNTGAIFSAPLGGGPLTTLASGSGVAGGQVAVDDAFVYWTDARAGLVMRVPKTGGPPITIASGQPTPTSIAVDATNVYWTNTGTVVVGTPAIVSAPKSGGPVVSLTSGAGIYWTLAVDATNVYSASGPGDGTGTIFSVPITGGSAVPLTSGSPTGLALDDTNVYFTSDPETSSSAGAVMRISKHGGPTTTIASDSNHPAGVAVDDSRVYWLDLHSVMSAPK